MAFITTSIDNQGNSTRRTDIATADKNKKCLIEELSYCKGGTPEFEPVTVSERL